MVATLTFSVLFVYIASERYRLRKQEDEVTALRRAISLQPSRTPSSSMDNAETISSVPTLEALK